MTAFEWIIAVCVIWFALLSVALLVGALVAWTVIRGAISRITDRVDALLKEGERITKSARETVDYAATQARAVADTARNIAQQAEHTARQVADRVTATTDLLRESVAEPAVRFSALLAGVRRGWDAWASRHRDRRSGGPSRE